MIRKKQSFLTGRMQLMFPAREMHKTALDIFSVLYVFPY